MLDYALGGLWVSEQDTERIYFVNTTTGAIIESFRAPLPNPVGLCVYNEYLWTGGYGWNHLYQVNLDAAPKGPDADFTATPRTGPAPLSVSFTDTSISYDGIVTRYWFFGDGSTSTQQNPTHTYTQAGNYTVTLSIWEVDSDTDTETKANYIRVSPPGPIAGFSATPRSGLEALMVVFSDQSISHDGVVSWSWSFGDGSNSTQQNPTHTYTQEGVYTVSLTIREEDGDMDTDTMPGCVEVAETRPAAGFSTTQREGSEPLTTEFTDKSSSHDGVVSWSWSFGDGSTSTQQNPTHTYTQDGVYTVSLTIREEDGNMDTHTIAGYITVSDTEPEAAFSATPTTGPEPLAVAFMDESTSYDGVLAWIWDFGDGSTGESRNPIHTYTRQGSYQVSLTVWEYDGDLDSLIKPRCIVVSEAAYLSCLTISGFLILSVLRPRHMVPRQRSGNLRRQALTN